MQGGDGVHDHGGDYWDPFRYGELRVHPGGQSGVGHGAGGSGEASMRIGFDPVNNGTLYLLNRGGNYVALGLVSDEDANRVPAGEGPGMVGREWGSDFVRGRQPDAGFTFDIGAIDVDVAFTVFGRVPITVCYYRADVVDWFKFQHSSLELRQGRHGVAFTPRGLIEAWQHTAGYWADQHGGRIYLYVIDPDPHGRHAA